MHVRPSDESFAVPSDEAGIAALLGRLAVAPPTLVVLEATGGYEAAVAAALAHAGVPVAVVNPRQIRDFARATGQLAKTDMLDARLIARFADTVQPPARPLATEQAHRQLVDMLAAEMKPLDAQDSRFRPSSRA